MSNIYLKLDGIPGNVGAKGYEQQILVHRLDWGAALPVAGATGSMANRTTGKASVHELSFSKGLDTASHELLKHMLKGKVIPKAVFSFVAATSGETVTYMELTLQNVIATSLTQQSSGEMPDELVTFNFSNIEVTHQLRDERGTAQPKRVSYDLKTNVVS